MLASPRNQRTGGITSSCVWNLSDHTASALACYDSYDLSSLKPLKMTRRDAPMSAAIAAQSDE